MRTRLLAAGSLALAALAALVVGPAVAPVPVSAAPATIDWAPCPDRPDDPALRCGTVQVPVDWAKPDGPTIGVAVAKRAADDPADDRGPLVINPGGPGGSGVDFAEGAEGYFSKNVLAHFDLIGFDPRGVGRSHPIRCSAALLAAAPEPVTDTLAAYRALRDYNGRLGADCRKHTGPLIDHVDTLSVVRDIDAIRAALGARQISYYGVSYGTLIGQQYAERYPHRLRAAVLDSNMDHSLGTAAFLATETATDEDSFDQFVAWNERTASSPLHGRDVAALYDRLMARADAGTLTDPDSGRPITGWELSAGAVSAFYGPDWTELATELATLDRSPAATPRAAGELADYPMPVFCSDYSLPVRSYRQFHGYLASMRAIAPHLRYSSIGWGAVTSCLGWPGRVSNPQHVLRAHPTTPLLVINARHDPATPYAWGVHDALMLGRHARFVTYDGWGHGTYGRSDCTTGYQDRYLLDRALPAPGASCAAVEPPAASARSVPARPTAPTRTAPGW
jgi:pimeloyl-ACP methyl ester carboxylesterase